MKYDKIQSEPLLDAIENDDIESARALLEGKANPNFVNLFGVTPLLLAVEGGSIEMFDLLVEHGAQPDLGVPGHDDYPLIRKAIHLEHDEIVEKMLDICIDLAFKSDNGDSLMHEAAMFNMGRAVVKMLDRNMNPNELNNQGMTPFHIAIYRDADDVVREVLDDELEENSEYRESLRSLVNSVIQNSPEDIPRIKSYTESTELKSKLKKNSNPESSLGI